jgi:hypothetical protein
MATSTPAKRGAESDEKLLLDWGARIGVAARRENVASSQLENLIASLNSVKGEEALLVASIFALRQAQRRERREEREEREQPIGPHTARLVTRALLELYQMKLGKEAAQRMLSFAKWVYEATKNKVHVIRTPSEQLTLESLLRTLAERDG